jgi:hypothetical protein
VFIWAQANYTDPATGLRYHDQNVYQLIKGLVGLQATRFIPDANPGHPLEHGCGARLLGGTRCEPYREVVRQLSDVWEWLALRENLRLYSRKVHARLKIDNISILHASALTLSLAREMIGLDIAGTFQSAAQMVRSWRRVT